MVRNSLTPLSRRVLAVLVLVVACSVAHAGAAAAAPFTLNGQHLDNRHHQDRCLDADTNTWWKIQLWQCEGVNDNQKWYGGTEAPEGAEIKTDPLHHGDLCLDAWDVAPPEPHGGFAVTLKPCNGARQQKWVLVRKGDNVVIRNVLYNRCLDVHREWSSNGSQVGLWECHEQINQQWAAKTSPPPPSPPQTGTPCDPQPPAPGLKLTASVGPRQRPVVTVGHRARPTVSGQLVDANGSPVAGAALCIGSSPVTAGASIQPTGSVTTGADGRFTFKLEPGTSRRVWIVHRVGNTAAAAKVIVQVRAPVRLRSSRTSLRTGERVTLSGRIGSEASTRGELVEIQAWRPGSWQTIGSVRVRKQGRFAWKYRFKRTVGVQEYRFRARLLGHRGAPFADSVSRTVRVRVSG